MFIRFNQYFNNNFIYLKTINLSIYLKVTTNFYKILYNLHIKDVNHLTIPHNIINSHYHRYVNNFNWFNYT